ncbi:D-erythronate dehydrogenase [Acidisphaera sp. L21]|uniref:D-erythronate dehydrogenase n=1 Tax=Acidisphaera sp. L21 TaxID=1641851 RepID=UPI00131AC321|nr:D-erythronate dehydrogenase [Acidisphaera sp. L21]
MTHYLVLGAGGMLGRKLVAALTGKLTLHDIVPPPAPPGAEVSSSDLSQPGEAERLVAGRPDVIYHLAAIVSGEAEADFEKGYRVNLDGTRHLLEAIRKVGGGYRPRLVFTSSLAVFGAPFPASIPDDFNLTPLSSYGTQKAIGELLVADYTRRGFIDGVGIRLPTICIRPGKPNKAASGFFSGILREPLNGMEAVLPVPETVRHWFASPRAAIGYLLHAGAMDTAALGGRRNLTMPGISATVADEIEALRRAAGDAAVALIRRVADPAVLAIVETWPERFDCTQALALGFKGDADFDEIVRIYQTDELAAG